MISEFFHHDGSQRHRCQRRQHNQRDEQTILQRHGRDGSGSGPDGVDADQVALPSDALPAQRAALVPVSTSALPETGQRLERTSGQAARFTVFQKYRARPASR
jgi:hypothetical protein